MTGGGNNTQQNGLNSTTQSGQQVPQWLKGLQAGQQIAALGAQQHPMQPQMPMQRPGGQIGGMPQGGVVPGAQGASPMMPSQTPGMASGGMGMPQGGGQMSPQMMQMLMQMRGGGGGGLMS
jgi:hypothetical protein